MAAWALMISGRLVLPLAFDPVTWHAHEFLFGYLGAVLAGFLLTAVPDWTGRPPLDGWSLGALTILWLVGRVVIASPAGLTGWQVAAVDLAFPLFLAAAITRE
ncbi:MAG: NnrS family protein, partial [Ferrovibrio sp.]